MNQKIELKKFFQHKHNAERRGIEFLFTFDEWITMWKSSGKWSERGHGSNKYCMARHNDTGPYAVWNVSIQTNRQNNQFAVTHRNNEIWLPKVREARKNKNWRDKITHEGNSQYKGIIVGTNIITGEQIILKGKNEINAAGFMHQHVYKCVNGKLNKHKGYTWTRR